MPTFEITPTVYMGITYNDEPDEIEIADKISNAIFNKLNSQKVKGMFDQTTISEVVNAKSDLWKEGHVVLVNVLKDSTWEVLVRRK